MKSIAKKLGVVALASASTLPAFALTEENNQAVTDAFASGEISVGIAVAGIIGLAAVMTGMRYLLRWIS